MIQINYKDYVLEYNREAIKMIEAKGFSFQNVADKLVTNFELIFWGAFQKNNKGINEKRTNEILDEMIAEGYDIAELQEVLVEMLQSALPLVQKGKATMKLEVIRNK